MIHINTIEKIAKDIPYKYAIIDNTNKITWQDYLNNVMLYIDIINGLSKNKMSSTLLISNECVDLACLLSSLTSLNINYSCISYELDDHKMIDLILNVNRENIICDVVNLNRIKNNLSEYSIGYTEYSLGNSRFYLLKIHNIPNHEKTNCHRNISFTSGTTNTPKIVLRSQSFEERRFKYFEKKYNFKYGKTYLSTIPLYHAAGSGWMKFFLNIRSTVIIKDNRNIKEVSETILEYKPIYAVFTTSTINNLSIYLKENDIISDSFNWILVGGKYFNINNKSRAIKFIGDCIYEYYGTTETGVNTIHKVNDSEINNVGSPIDGINISIDITGSITTMGKKVKIGKVCIDGYMNMDGYKGKYLNGKCIYTGDIGYIENKKLYILSRDNIYCNDIYVMEDILSKLDKVDDVSVIGYKKNLIIYVVCSVDEIDDLVYEVKREIKKWRSCDVDVFFTNMVPSSKTGKAIAYIDENTKIHKKIKIRGISK